MTHGALQHGRQPAAERARRPTTTAAKGLPRWPLFLIAAPASVAVWAGWVGLGQLAGFGLVQPLPGIVPWHLDTAITLPVGVEAYGAYALGAWLRPGGISDRARTFARRSAIGALCLGMTGQVAFHLLSAAHATRAPWAITLLVACMPVCTLGFGVALTHLLRSGAASDAAEPDASGAQPANARVAAPAIAARASASGSRSAVARRSRAASASRTRNRLTDADAEVHFAADLASGELPSVRRIQRELHVGQPRAQQIRQHLATLPLSPLPVAIGGAG